MANLREQIEDAQRQRREAELLLKEGLKKGGLLSSRACSWLVSQLFKSTEVDSRYRVIIACFRVS